MVVMRVTFSDTNQAGPDVPARGEAGGGVCGDEWGARV